jgi:hypothetical protein
VSFDNRRYPSEHYLIDAIRACLGLDPLYGEPKQSPLWDSMPFEDGCKRLGKRGHTDHSKQVRG